VSGAKKEHRASGWTRESVGDGSGNQRITPTDGSGERIVAFLSAGSWQNYPSDDRAKMETDRVVLLSGPSLPEWAMAWLEGANRKQQRGASASFRAMVADADDAPFRNTGW